MKKEAQSKIEATSVVSKEGEMFFDVLFTDGCEQIKKRLGVEEFAQMLDKSLERERVYVTLPKVPDGVVALNAAEKPADFSAFYFEKGRKRQFVYASKVGERVVMIPFPDLLFYVDNREGHRELCVAAVSKISNETYELANYPFGNVYESGKVCMGNILVTCKDVTEIEKVVEAFFTGVTNEHLFDAERSNTRKLSQDELLDMLESLEEFPGELLVSRKTSIAPYQYLSDACGRMDFLENPFKRGLS